MTVNTKNAQPQIPIIALWATAFAHVWSAKLGTVCLTLKVTCCAKWYRVCALLISVVKSRHVCIFVILSVHLVSFVGDGFYELCTPTAGVCNDQETSYDNVITFTGNPVRAQPLGVGVDGDGNAIFCRSNGLLYRYNDEDGTLAEWVTYSDGGDPVTDTNCVDVDVGPHFGDVYYITETGFLRVFSNTSQVTTTLLTTGLGDAAGIAVDTRPIGEEKIYISDTSGNVIREYDHENDVLTTLAISGLSGPTGLAIDRPNGNSLYICDTGNSLVKKYDFSDGTVTTLPFVLNEPSYVAIDFASQEIFITDRGENEIYRFNRIDDEYAGTSISVLPTSFGGFNLNTPVGVAVTLSGTILVADSVNKRILKLPCNEIVYKCDVYDETVNTEQGGEYTGAFPVFGGDDISSQDIDTCNYGYTFNAISSWECNASTGIAHGIQPFCVPDGGNCIDMNTTLVTIFTAAGYAPYYLDVDSADNIIFTGIDTGDSSFNVYHHDVATDTTTTLYTLLTATIGGVAIDNTGNLFVVEPDSGSIFQGECLDFSAGTCNDYAATLDLWSDAFTTPVALDLDPANNLYVADAGTQKVLKYNNRGSLIATLIGSGVLDTPVGVAMDDETGDLYVSDKANNKIYHVACDDLNNNCDIVTNCPFRSLCDANRDPAFICCPDGWAGETTDVYCTLPDSVDIYSDYFGEDPPADTCALYGGVVAHDTDNSRYTCATDQFQACDTYSSDVTELVTGLAPEAITVDRDGNVVYINSDSATVEKYHLSSGSTEVVIAAGLTTPFGPGLTASGDFFIADPGAVAMFRTSCLELEPTCSDSEHNGLEEGVDCGGNCPDRCQDIAADPVWFVYRDHGITTSAADTDDYIDHGVQTLEQCQGLCHAGEAPNADGRQCVGFTMATDILNWPLGAACITYYTNFDESQCLKRELTGAKSFLCFPAPPLYLQDYVVFEEDDLTAFLYKRGDDSVMTGLVWYGLGEHQHISNEPADYVSLGALPLEDCMTYCVEYEGCLGITNDYALFHEECILYMTDFAQSVCYDYDTFTERCSDLYPYNNMNVVKSNAAYNAYVFDASNYNGFILFRTHVDSYLDGTVDGSTTEASFLTSIEDCKLYCMKHDSCRGFRSDDSDCIIYSSYIDGTGLDSVRTSVNISAPGVEHWMKYQQWLNAKCDPDLSTGQVDHGTTFKLSDCLSHCEVDVGCSAVEFSFIASTCVTFTTCIGQLQTPLHSVYGTVGFIESPTCADLEDWTSPSGRDCTSSSCIHNSIYLAHSDGSYWPGVENDTIAPDCLDVDCCEWRCFYSEECVTATFRPYSELFWSFEDDGYPCTTYVNLSFPRTLIVGSNISTITQHFVKIYGFDCEDGWDIVLEDGTLGTDAGVDNILDCRDSCADNTTCWGFTWQPTTLICKTFSLQGGVVPVHNLTGDTSLLACRGSHSVDNTVPEDVCCSCGGGVYEYPLGAQTCVNDGRVFPVETSPLCVTFNTTTPAGSILAGNMIVLEESSVDGSLWSIASENLEQQTVWCDRNTDWDLDVRACKTQNNVTNCSAVLHTSPGSVDYNGSITCSITASGCPANFPYGFNLGVYCCDVTTNETHQIDDPIPDDLSWTTYVETTDVTVYASSTASAVHVNRHGADVSFDQCGGSYVECPQSGTYQLGDNCRNHTGYWNVPAENYWRAVDQNGIECNQTLYVENEVPYDLGEPEVNNNTWYIEFETEVRYFFNGFRIKMGTPEAQVIQIHRSRFGTQWNLINGANYTIVDGLGEGFIYEFQDFDTFSGSFWRVVITSMYERDENPEVYWVQFYTPLEKPCLVPTIPNGQWSGDGCFEQQDQAQDLTCFFEANEGYYCSFYGDYYCDAGTWLFTATSLAEDQDPYKDTDDPNGLGYGNYDGNLRNDRDGWDETIDFKLNPVVPDHIRCYPCNPENECPVGEYMIGCEKNSPGSCGPCTNAVPGTYYTSNARVASNCSTAVCDTNCPTGQYRSGCDQTTSEGECVDCSGPAEGFYFTGNGNLSNTCPQTECPTVDNCNVTKGTITCTNVNTSHCPICDDGYWLYEDLFGPDQCRLCNKICPIGSYLKNCGNDHYPYFNRYATDRKCSSGLGATLLSYTTWTNGTDCAASCKEQIGCTMFDNSEAFDPELGYDVPFCHMFSNCDSTTLQYSNGSSVFEYVSEELHDGVCTPCTGAPSGSYYTTTGNEKDNCDFATCPNITDCVVPVTCVANVSTEVPESGEYDYPSYQVQPTSVRCSQCDAEMFVDNYTCSEAEWRLNDACVAAQDLCVSCSPVANCVSEVSCTSLTNSQCTECSSSGNYYIDNTGDASECKLLSVRTFTEETFNASFGTWAAQCNGDTFAFGTSQADDGSFENYTVVELEDLIQGISSIFQSDSSDTIRWSWDLTSQEKCFVSEYFAQFVEPSVSVVSGPTYAHYVFNIGHDNDIATQVIELVQNLQLAIDSDANFSDVFEFVQLTSLPSNTAFATATLYSKGSTTATVDYAAMLQGVNNLISPASYYTTVSIELYDSEGQYIGGGEVEITACLANALDAFMSFTLDPRQAHFSTSVDIIQQVGTSNCYAVTGAAGAFVMLANGCDGIAPAVSHGTAVCDLATEVGDTCPVINEVGMGCTFRCWFTRCTVSLWCRVIALT